jgi:hypothetical protein
MPTIRSFANSFDVVDWTEELSIVPNSWTLLGDMGVFKEEFLTQHTVTFEERDRTIGLIGDQYRGQKPSANKDELRKIHSYPIPHFPYVDYITPQDIQGKRAYGSMNVETKDAVMMRKLERIRKNMDATKEVSRFKTLTTGNVYAPNGTISGNFFTDFGVTQTSVDFVLGTAGTDISAKCEAITSAMQDNANSGDVISGVVAFCSPTWFAKLIAHAKVQTAYQYYTATEGQSILRNRAGQVSGTNNGGLYREFFFGGIRFIEVRTVLGGQTLIPTGEAVAIPVGQMDAFTSFYSPANKLSLVNTVAESGYVFSYQDPRDENITIDTEFNMINVLRRPALVCKITSSN